MSRLKLIVTGGTLLVLGWVLAFLVTMDILSQSFPKALLIFVLLTVGTIIGFYGLFLAYRDRRGP